MVDLRSNAARIDALGVEMVLIGQGSPAETKQFVARHRWPWRSLSDESRAAFRAFGLLRAKPLEVAGPAVMAAGMAAAIGGHFASRPVGDVMQMPGLFVVDTAGTVRYAHRFRHIADHPGAARLADIVAHALED